ncbi:MAG: septal ring lytic transglycosylase RlpA family protein [Rhodospirillales bacterium]|nr:septal ring lytic transglycosylase RlpA family protein [Rhodospirillales bacterium]
MFATASFPSLTRLIAVLGVFFLGLAGCTKTNVPATVLKETTPPQPTGNYKVGNPYEINGVWYYPEEDPFYDEVGIASWYGKPFHGRTAASGEIYDMNELTAAHKTLPMPVYVRVTNLENDRSLVLRVNDRGPFVEGRIIDVSRRAAQLLDFEAAGITRVRVQVIDPETQQTYAEMGQEPPPKDGFLAATETIPPTEVIHIEEKVSGDVFVQVGAYANADNAFVVSNALTELGEVQIDRVIVDDTVLYRVRIGPYATGDAAELTRREVAFLGYPEAIIIVDP